MISWVALAYSLKFLWAPLLDRFDAPFFGARLGRRRGWMALIQIGAMLCLAGLAFGEPAKSLAWTIAFSFLLGFCGSTQDITIDGWRIAVAPPEKQGALSAASQVGYKIALLCSGAGALYIAQFQSWRAAYLAMACLMVVGFIANLFAPEPKAHIESSPGARKSLVETYAEPLKEFFARNGRYTLLFLLLLAIYRLPDFLSGVMANPLYIDLGFSKTDIANITKIFGFGVGLFGIFVGGWCASRFGLMPTLLVGGLAASASHLSLALLAACRPRHPHAHIGDLRRELRRRFCGHGLDRVHVVLGVAPARRRAICAVVLALRAARARFSGVFRDSPSPSSAIPAFSRARPALACRWWRSVWRSGASMPPKPRLARRKTLWHEAALNKKVSRCPSPCRSSPFPPNPSATSARARRACARRQKSSRRRTISPISSSRSFRRWKVLRAGRWWSAATDASSTARRSSSS